MLMRSHGKRGLPKNCILIDSNTTILHYECIVYVMPRAPIRGFAHRFRSSLNLISFSFLDSHLCDTNDSTTRTFSPPPAYDHELTIHPWGASNEFDPSRLGEATEWGCQRFVTRSVILFAHLRPHNPAECLRSGRIMRLGGGWCTLSDVDD